MAQRDRGSLPRSDDGDDSKWVSLDITLQSIRVSGGLRDILEAVFCNGDQMLGSVESTVDLSSSLRDGSVSLRLISLTVRSFGERRHVPSHLHGDFLG
jgi:hypothetical protein